MADPRGRWLRSPWDLLSVAVTSLLVAIQLTLAVDLPHWAWIVFVPVGARWVGLVEHNHVHVPVFRRGWMNEVFDVFLWLGTGMPVQLYRIHHVEVHHRFENRPEDWTSPFAYPGAKFPDQPIGLGRYIVTFTPRAWNRCIPMLFGEPERRRDQVRFLRAFVVVGASLSVLLAINWRGALVFVVGSWLFTAFGSAYANWRHHEGCDYETEASSSNLDLGVFSRWLGFNIGYHAVHHSYPAMHWSQLPLRYRDEFSERVPRERVRSPMARRSKVRVSTARR